MHSLVAVQQQVLSSVSRASQSLLWETCASTLSSSSSSPLTLFSVSGSRIRRVQESRNFGAKVECDERSSSRYGRVRSLASRKDRRDAASNEPGAFKPDIAGLKSGLAKRFPTEASNFTYDWDSDDEEDEDVEVRSFAGRRDSPKEISRASSRDGYQMRSSGGPRNYGRGNSNGDERSGRCTPRASGSEYSNVTGGRSSSGRSRGEPSSTDPSARNREAYERRLNGGKPVASGARSTENRFSSGRGQGSRSAGSDASGARNSRPSAGALSNSTPARSFRDDGNDAAAKSSQNGSFQRTGRREWVDEVEKKKKPVVEPVIFNSPMNKVPNIAILGGGMSGLMCALRLEELGINSTVFDTGKHGLGGRMATRTVVQRPGMSPLEFDHAAQFFTVTDAWLQMLVNRWISGGAVSEWKGSVGHLQAGGKFTELPPATRYVGSRGMRYLADHIVSGARRIEVRRPCWISKMMANNGRWTLMENNKFQGEFDAVVIAHNGKCANRLLAPAGVPLIARQMKRLELSSIWALMAAFEKPLPSASFEGAFVDGVSSLSWMGNNSAKLQGSGDQPLECWTFFSTALYGRKNKVPQESIPLVKGEKVLREMLAGVEVALGLPAGSMPAPLYHRLQLWGAALPTNTPDTPCIFDAQGRVGICGDWLLGSSLEAAALSGKALAEHIGKYCDSGDRDSQQFNIGLQTLFKIVDGHDIGQFPGTSDLPMGSANEVMATV